jgi:hypothetical protein
MKGSLFPRLAFSPDETHASWAGRLAAFHIAGEVGEFLRDLRIPQSAFLNGHTEFVERLCHIADQEPKVVISRTILRRNPIQYSLNGEVFGSGMLVGKLTKFCPHCLLVDDAKGSRPNVQRREQLAWRFRSVLVCPVHHVFLMEAPTPPVWLPDLSSRVPLGSDIVKMLVDRSIPATPSPVQSYLLDRIAGVSGPEWLDGQAIDQATRATEILGAVMQFGSRVSIGSLTIEDWHRAGHVGWASASKGEAGLREAFKVIQAREPEPINARYRHPGNKFGALYRWLSLKTNYDDRGPIRDVLRDHIIETEALTTNRKILGKLVLRNTTRAKGRGLQAE